MLELDQREALRFWQKSPHATAFNNPALSKYFSNAVRWFLAAKGETPYVLWPVSQGVEGLLTVPPHTYYFGPMWSEEAWNKSITSRMADAQNCYGKLLEKLFTLSSHLEFELHPTISDVRFFSWWNYGDSEAPKFTIEPRYSAVIQGLQLKTEAELFSRMRKWRRIEVRRASRNPRYSLADSANPEELLNLREKTFARQGIAENKSEEMSRANLANLMLEPNTTVTAVIDNESGDVVAANLALDGADNANLIFNHLDFSYKSEGVGPLATFNAIIRARDRGIHYFDFNGANSPKRGDDKHSYGAFPLLYFRLRL